jgi:hypothetical protein
MAIFADMPEMEAARQRMDDRVRRARSPRRPGHKAQHLITHQLRRISIVARRNTD